MTRDNYDLGNIIFNNRIMLRAIGIEFCWVPPHGGAYRNETSDTLIKRGAMKKYLKYHTISYC